MRCEYFDDGRCRSCTFLRTPYPEQLATKVRARRELLTSVPAGAWLEPVASADEGFRNKAKMVVAGRTGAPTLGILDPAGAGVDLRGCHLYPPPITEALPVVADMIARAGLVPYDVPGRRGELKHVLVTVSPAGELMMRFVLRSRDQLGRIRRHLPRLLSDLPNLAVVTVNLLPAHVALLEGEEEIVLTERSALPMRLSLPGGPLDLELPPRSFFQTNTAIAEAMYGQAAAWAAEIGPGTAWDLYCGVGGFALAVAKVGTGAGEGATADATVGAGAARSPRVVGIESSPDAVAGARAAAARGGVADRVTFADGDATAWALASSSGAPDLVVVNPPRRGLSEELAGRLEGSGAGHVLYSSCNATTLARDLGRMPSLAPVAARLFDMFPHTAHDEVMVLLERV
ncbi:methyltransferase domain-containing protein [Georgenia sp. Z1491]|uniref:methyltransferase domain-containing protein n=1 Tax=Georgenia sp. Z1491 TaxID=3416707 RepID=UPI003CF1B29D